MKIDNVTKVRIRCALLMFFYVFVISLSIYASRTDIAIYDVLTDSAYIIIAGLYGTISMMLMVPLSEALILSAKNCKDEEDALKHAELMQKIDPEEGLENLHFLLKQETEGMYTSFNYDPVKDQLGEILDKRNKERSKRIDEKLQKTMNEIGGENPPNDS
jgi:hypothetical protein